MAILKEPSDGRCPNPVFNPTTNANIGVSWFGVIAILVIGVPLATLYFIYRNRFSALKERGLPFVALHTFGDFLQILWPLRELVGRENFSCMILANIISISLLVKLFPITTRIILFYNRIRLNQALAKAKYAVAVDNVLELSSKIVPYGGLEDGDDEDEVKNALKKSDQELLSKTVSEKVMNSISTGVALARQTSHTTNSVTEETVVGENQPEIDRLRFRSSHKFGFIILGVAAVGTLIAVIHNSIPVWGCIGCELDVKFVLQAIVLMMVLSFISGYYIWQIRNEPDPFQMKLEFYLVSGICIFFGPVLLLHIFDPKDLEKDNVLTWHHLWVVATLCFLLAELGVPLYASYQIHKLSKAREMRNKGSGPALVGKDLTLDEILSSETGTNLFKAHLVKELCFENFMFYKDVSSWRDYYMKTLAKHPDDLQAKKNLLKAKKIIVKKYLEIGGNYEVNVSFTARQDAIASTTEVSMHDFEACYNEIWGLLDGHPLIRFKQSPEYKILLGEAASDDV